MGIFYFYQLIKFLELQLVKDWLNCGGSKRREKDSVDENGVGEV